LRVLGRAGIGVDTIDVAAATRAGVVVMNTPFGNSVTTAEHTIAMMMSLARSIPQAHASTKAGKWEKSAFMGVELASKVLGVVGCGNIGSIVAMRARAFGMKVMAFDPYLTPARALELGVVAASLDEVLAQADFITLHTPLTDQTRGIINGTAMAKMKRGVRIINCARGGLVVEADLHTALQSGHVAGAALDVFEVEPATDNPLFALPNVIATPHLGASTAEAQENVARQIAEQISDFLLVGAVANAVNMPSLSPEEAPHLRPFLHLVGQLGAFAAALGVEPITQVQVTYRGGVARMKIKALTATLLAALLGASSDHVNAVNAFEAARARGIDVEESQSEQSDDLESVIQVAVTTKAGTATVSGTVLADRRPRLIAIDGVAIEAMLAPHMLLVRNNDQPGMIGALGTVLAQHNVNIADFRLGRVAPKGQAVALVTLDTPLDDKVMTLIRALPHIRQATALDFTQVV
jgi:D-3-phosphoglycerate dehydrogenase